MDPRFTEFSNSTKDFKFDDDSFLPAFDQAENPANMFKFKDDILKYIKFILMEENMEQKPSLFHDPLALQETEKSLYDVIGEKYPASLNEPPLYFNPNVKSHDCLFSSSSEQSINSNTSGCNSIDSP
ncbi:hypothetical protein ACSBR1_033395 [Camellia fascicularis]